MRSFTLIAFFAFVAQANGNEVAANDMDDAQADQLVDQVLNKLASKLIDRVLTASSLPEEGMDSTTLGKPREEVIIIDEPQDDNALDDVLGLRGGAAMKAMKAMKTPMKAMKAPMKSPMKSPMKAMKKR